MKTLSPLLIAAKFTDETFNWHYKIQAAVGFILNNYHNLEGTKMHSQKVRNLGKKFYQALDESELQIVKFKPKEVERLGAMEQLNDSYQVFENILNALFELDPEKLKQFSFQLEELFNLYKK